ncbi:MAG: 30S ribosomal protein S6 [Verrucomicrobiales bacterium]
MKRYEALFILNTAGKEETVKELIDRLSDDLTAAGGKVEAVQKMDKRPFSRISDKRVTSGFYVNVVFAIDAAKLTTLRNKFAMNADIYRVSFTIAPEPKPEPVAA